MINTDQTLEHTMEVRQIASSRTRAHRKELTHGSMQNVMRKLKFLIKKGG